MMHTMEGRARVDRVALAMLERVQGIAITSDLHAGDNLLRQEEGEGFYRRTLSAYARDLARHPGRERSVTHRYAKILWREVSPHTPRKRT